VVLTMAEDRFAVLEALRAGARGYLLKGAGRATIVDAVRRAAAGGAVFDEDAADIVIALAAGGAAAPHIALGITEREAGVLRLVATGLTNQAIAARLGLAPKTVRNVVSVVFVKLGVSSREEAINRARMAGL
jgi:DNA-binding NarL/FixJ family response regulator